MSETYPNREKEYERNSSSPRPRALPTLPKRTIAEEGFVYITHILQNFLAGAPNDFPALTAKVMGDYRDKSSSHCDGPKCRLHPCFCGLRRLVQWDKG